MAASGRFTTLSQEKEDVEQGQFPTLLTTGERTTLMEQKVVAGGGEVAKTPQEEEDAEQKQFPPGGPLWFNIYAMILHIVFAMFQSSFSYIPYVGDSPVWLRCLLFVGVIVGGITTHLQGYFDRAGILSLSKVAKIGNLAIPPQLFGLVLWMSKFCAVLPVKMSVALVIGFILFVLVLPDLVYKKITGKNNATNVIEITEATTTCAGVVHHITVDSIGCLFYVGVWLLMWPEYQDQVMAWVPFVRANLMLA